MKWKAVSLRPAVLIEVDLSSSVVRGPRTGTSPSNVQLFHSFSSREEGFFTYSR